VTKLDNWEGMVVLQ